MIRLLLVALLLVGVGFTLWYTLIRNRRDPEAAIAANNRGVGEMEHFRYAEAVNAFRDARKNDPDWIVPRVNLAIAILHESKGKNEEVEKTLREVLREDPDNTHANYTLGFYLKHNGNTDAAFPLFERVSQLDPNDAYTWFHLGVCHPEGEDSPAAIACFQKALRLNPYLNAARYKLFTLARAKERQALLDEVTQLKLAFWEDQYSPTYTEQGPYSEVIGRTHTSHPAQPTGPIPPFDPWPEFHVHLAAGSRLATQADLGEGSMGVLRRAVRERFGAALVLFDYNRDGRPDLLVLSAVVRAQRVHNLLLRNDGGGRFVDVTAEAGLSDSPPSFGCAVGDFDNDDSRDILFTGIDGIRLFRNTGAGQFSDMTVAAGLDRIGGVFLAAAWVDLDQDSDIDAVAGRLADNSDGALRALRGEPTEGGRLEVLFNRGDAPPVPVGHRQPPLKAAFGRVNGSQPLSVPGAVTGVVSTDLDGDRDVDLLVLADAKPPTAIRNDRLLRFARFDGFPAEGGAWVGGAVLDVNQDGRSDIFLLEHGKSPQVLLSKGGKLLADANQWFVAGTTNSPPIVQAACVDLDADGWTDVIGLGADRRLVFLHNDGQNRLVNRADALGPPFPDDLSAVNVADLDGDCHLDIIGWSQSLGLRAFRGQDNGNKSLRLELSGRYENDRSRTNADGIGCKIIAQSGRLWAGLENTSLWAGLGQSRLPLSLGLGRRGSVDAVRILWPDGVPQAELGRVTCETHHIVEVNRKPTSCPVLSVWDGHGFRYVTDFLGGGALGESGPDGAIRPPRPEESVKIEPGLMTPKDGRLLLKMAEPMDELMYLDRVQLLAVDHPEGVEVHPDERFVVAGPLPTQELLVFETAIHPARTTDHKGRDVTATLRERDKMYVSDFARRSWLGYAEDHFVELDFDDRLARIKPEERVFLVMSGWTDYAYPESIYAATQAGVPSIVPTLERLSDDGTWRNLGEVGFPAGLPRVMTKEVTGLIGGPSCRLRIRTNLSVYWDRIVIAPLAELAAPEDGRIARVTEAPLSRATLASRGFIQEIRPNGRSGPVEYDDTRTETVAVTPWRGMLTRLGDVTGLASRADDCFVLCGPGDEVTVAFDAEVLPPLRKGYSRSYVLRTWGYCKDTAPTTVSGGRVEPLPVRGMKNYPHLTPEEREKADAGQAEYRRKWNTRPAAGGPD